MRKARCAIVIVVDVRIFLVVLVLGEIVVEWMLCCAAFLGVLTLPAAVCMVQLPEVSLCRSLRLAKFIRSTFCLNCGLSIFAEGSSSIVHDAHKVVPSIGNVDILLDLKLVFLAGLHILKEHLHMVVSVRSGLFVHFAQGVENLVKDCILGEAAGDLQVDSLLSPPPAKIGPAPTAIIAVVSEGCELDVVPTVTLDENQTTSLRDPVQAATDGVTVVLKVLTDSVLDCLSPPQLLVLHKSPQNPSLLELLWVLDGNVPLKVFPINLAR